MFLSRDAFDRFPAEPQPVHKSMSLINNGKCWDEILTIKFISVFTSGWKDSLLSLPKKWLSQTGAVDEFGFPLVR